MREIARKTIENGAIEEEYVIREHNGDIALECGVPGADVFKPDSFHIPTELRSWLSAAIAPVVAEKPALKFERDLTFSARAVRIFAERVKTDMPHLSAQAVLRMVADILDGGASAMEPAEAKMIPIFGVIEGGKVVPMGGGIERRFSP